jgi:hypothetical protein
VLKSNESSLVPIKLAINATSPSLTLAPSGVSPFTRTLSAHARLTYAC